MTKLSKSVEGGQPTIIELKKEVAAAILEYNKAHEVFNYLLFNCMMTDETQGKLAQRITELSKLIKESGCMNDKYDWRAHYTLID